MEQNSTVKRRIKASQLRRKLNRNSAFFRKTYKFLRFVFVVILFYFAYQICGLKGWYIDAENFYNGEAENIEILGNEIVSRERILNTIREFNITSEPIYKLNPSAMTNKLTKITPIEKTYIRRYAFPARLVIMVDEILPVITISPSENAPDVVAFAITGELITRDFLPLPNHIKTTRILSYGTQGDDYHDWNKEKVLMLYNLARATEEYSGENVEYIDLRTPNNAVIKISSVKIKVGEINNSTFETIKEIHNILPAVKQMKKDIKYIDLSWEKTKYLKMEKSEEKTS